MNEGLYTKRMRRCIGLSLAMHLVLLVTWPPAEPVHAHDEALAEVVELVLIAPTPVVSEIEGVDHLEESQEVTPEEVTVLTMFEFVDSEARDDDDAAHSDASVLAAISEAPVEEGTALVTAKVYGDEAIEAPAAPAAPSSVAVAAAIGDMSEQDAQVAKLAIAQKPTETVAKEVVVAVEALEMLVAVDLAVPELADADVAAFSDAQAAVREVLEAAPEEVLPQEGLREDALSVAVADAGFMGEVETIVVPPSMAFSGATGALGGERGSEQSVLLAAADARRTKAHRKANSLGRYTRRVYKMLRKRWHKHNVEGMVPFEAEVVVSFRIARGGMVGTPTVVLSSGDVMLDAMARASVPKRVGRFPMDLQQDAIVQEITFVYQP